MKDLDDRPLPEAIGDATPRLSNCNPLQSTRQPLSALQPDLQSFSSTSSSQMDEQWKRVLQVPPGASSGNYNNNNETAFHPVSQSFSSLENDSALKDFSDAFGSSLSSSAEGGSYNDKKRLTTTTSLHQQQTVPPIKTKNNSKQSSTSTTSLDDERQSTDALLQIMASLEQDALRDIRQALHETTSTASSSSSNHPPMKQKKSTTVSKIVTNVPSLSSSTCSPPSDFFPMDDESISITDSFVLHRTVKKEKKGKTEKHSSGVSVDDDDDDSGEEDSTVVALRQQVELLNNLLDDMQRLDAPQPRESFEDGLDEEISRLEQCEHLIQAELEAIDQVLWMSPSGILSENNHYHKGEDDEDTNSGRRSVAGIDSGDKETGVAVNKEAEDGVGSSNPGNEGSAESTDTTETSTGMPTETNQMGEDGARERKSPTAEIEKAIIQPKKSFPADHDLQQLQEQMQREELQAPETRDEVVEIKDCRSCEEIVAVASAGWSDLQALQWGAATNNNNASIAVDIRIDPQKLPQDTETDPKFDAAPIEKDNINKNEEDMSEDIDDNLSGSVPRRIHIPNPLSPTKSLPSLENTTLGLDGVSSSETMESSMESNFDKDDDNARIERLAAQARAHTQASLLAITTMARGLDNKSPPRRRIPVQKTTSPRIETGLSEAQSPSGTKASLICAPEVFSLTSSPSYSHADAKDQIPNTNERASLPSKEKNSREKKSYHIPDDHLQLYEDTDKVLADNSDTCKEKRPRTLVFRTVASPTICDAAAKKMLNLEKSVLQNAKLSEKNDCVDDCRDVGEGIEQTMSRFLEDNCIVMDHLNEPLGISSPLSQHTMTSLADTALNEHSSCEESVRHSEAAKGSGYQHVPSLERMMNSSPQKLVEQSSDPSVLLQTRFICNQRTSLNDAACDRISKLRQRRPQVLADAFVSEFEDEKPWLATPKEESEKIHDMIMKSSWMDEDVESLPDTPILLEEDEAGRRAPLDFDFPRDETVDRKEQKQPSPLVRKKPFGNINSKGPKSTNPFEHEEEDQWIEDRRFREQNSTNPFDDPIDDLNPFNDDCHSSDNSLANTMTTTTTIADQPNLNFELDFASDVVPISISPSTSPVNEDEAGKKAKLQSLEAIVNSPRDLRSAPSDEFCNAQSPIIRRCPSDEGMESALGDRSKRVLASLTPTPRKTIGAPSDKGGLPFSPSKISKMLSEGTSHKGTNSPKKRRKYLSALLSGHSVRKQLSPKKIPRKRLVALKDAATSPISAVLRSLPSIREEKSAESNENIKDETPSLLQAPTDEGWNHYERDDDDASKEHDIQDTLSRLAARIQGRASADDVDSTKVTNVEKPETNGDDPLYDCVDRICGDEDVSTLQRNSRIGANNEGLEKVMTINSTGRLLSANNSDFTSDENGFVAPSASAEDKIRGVGIHVTCISQKHSTLPMSEEVPSLGIELVYYEEDRFTMTAAATESQATSEENELDDSRSMEATAKEGCVQRSDEQLSQEDTEEDTYGFPVDDNYFSHVVPKSISFVDRPGMRNDGTDVQNATDIVKAVSYHNDHDIDRLLEEHPIQTSLWTKVQESRLKAKEDSSSTATSINSSMVAHTGTDRDPTTYCESIETLQHQDSTTTNTPSASASFQSSSYHSSIPAHRYEAIVQTLLNKTQRLLDSMMKFDFLEYASLTTDDITGVQMDGRFLQGRSFHSYYGCTKKPTTMKTAFAGSKQKRRTQTATTSSATSSPSFLDQVPIQQSVLSPTVRLVSPQVAVVSYQVIRKTLEKGRVIERALYETRIWENRLPQGTTAREGKMKQEEAETEDAWLNCHYHVSAMAPAVTGGGASGNTLSRSSAVASSLVAAQQKQLHSNNTATSSSNSNSSSSIPYYDI